MHDNRGRGTGKGGRQRERKGELSAAEQFPFSKFRKSHTTKRQNTGRVCFLVKSAM